MTRYLLQAEPGGPRSRAMIEAALREAGATVQPGNAYETRSAPEVAAQVVRLTFEIAGGLALVWDLIGKVQEQFPSLRVHIEDDDEDDGRPTGYL